MYLKERDAAPPETSPPEPAAQPISVVQGRHQELMEAYVSVLRQATSRENEPPEGKSKGWAKWGWVRRFVHGHVHRQMRELGAAYVARIGCVGQAAENERGWLVRADGDMAKLAGALRPWQLRLGGRTAALLAIVASVTGIVKDFEAPQLVLDTAFWLFLGSACGLAGNALLTLLLLRWAFLAKRRLLLDGSIYQKEDALFGAIGIRKRREALTDFAILQISAFVASAYLAAALALLEVLSVNGVIGVGLGAEALAFYVLSALEHRTKKRRSLR